MCDHLNLTVNNLEQSVQWYEDIFGFHVVEGGQYRNDRDKLIIWKIIRRDDFMLCLYEEPQRLQISENDETLHRIFHFGLRIQNFADFVLKLQNLGDKLKVHWGPIQYPHSTSWYIRDPSGYEIEATYWNDGIRF